MTARRTKTKKCMSPRVGSEYQADIPDIPQRKQEDIQLHADRSEMLCWKPTHKLTDDQLNEYVTLAKEFRYSEEQALGVLSFNKNDLKAAKADLPCYEPCTSGEFGTTEQALLEHAVQGNGNRNPNRNRNRQFTEIQKMLPGRSVQSIIGNFYNWKTRQKIATILERINKGSDKSTMMSIMTALGSDVKKPVRKSSMPTGCGNCNGTSCRVLYTNLNLCSSCYSSWKKKCHLPVARKGKEERLLQKSLLECSSNLKSESPDYPNPIRKMATLTLTENAE